MLEGIGEDLTRPGIKRTPERVASSMAELCRGLDPGSRKPIAVMSEADQNEMIIVKDISFSSMCEHHLLPYIGRCDIVYLPADDRIAGLSAIVELVENLAARPTIQERLTTEIANTLMAELQAKGVMVVMEAEHMCLAMRGCQEAGQQDSHQCHAGLSETAGNPWRSTGTDWKEHLGKVITVRLLQSGDGVDWTSLIKRVGADTGALPRLQNRDRITVILVEGLPSPAASILKQSMLSGGADALVHREVLTCGTDFSDGVVYGTPSSIRRGCDSLDGQPFGLGSLGADIRGLLVPLSFLLPCW